MDHLLFSGHETFHCRQFWLKKGFDFLVEEKSFTDPEAVVDLGVGKNMVGSIRFWLKAFDILGEKGDLNQWAKNLFANDGWDPFLEDEGSLWLLHFKLLSKNYSSIYQIIFSELRTKRAEFTEQHFINYALRNESKNNVSTLKKDFTVFYRLYHGIKNEKDLEESFSGLLSELGLLIEIEKPYFNEKGKLTKKQYWLIEKKARPSLPSHILLYSLLDNKSFGDSISFEDLMTGETAIGNIFSLSRDGLDEALEGLQNLNYGLVYNSEAGVKELQFKKGKPNSSKVLEDYYGI